MNVEHVRLYPPSLEVSLSNTDTCYVVMVSLVLIFSLLRFHATRLMKTICQGVKSEVKRKCWHQTVKRVQNSRERNAALSLIAVTS